MIDLDTSASVGNLRTLAGVSEPSFPRFMWTDACMARAITPLLPQFGMTAAIHAVAETHVVRTITGPSELFRSTFSGAFTLAKTAHA